jgi:hypothetical protein
MKKILALLTLALLQLTAATAWPRASSTSIHITARVDPFAEWADPSPVILATEWSGPINKVNQNRTATKSVVLYTNTNAIISAKPGPDGGILSNGSQTLTTAYKLTGDVSNPDASFKDSAQFLSTNNTYNVTHQSGVGSYTVNLEVQATSPADTAPEIGLYTCTVTLTAAW